MLWNSGFGEALKIWSLSARASGSSEAENSYSTTLMTIIRSFILNIHDYPYTQCLFVEEEDVDAIKGTGTYPMVSWVAQIKYEEANKFCTDLEAGWRCTSRLPFWTLACTPHLTAEENMHVFVSSGYLKKSIPSYALLLVKHATREMHKCFNMSQRTNQNSFFVLVSSSIYESIG